MKRRHLNLGCAGIALLVVCLTVVLIARPAEAEKKSITLTGFGDCYSGGQNKVSITLVENKPGIYTATGILSLYPTWTENLQIKGTYYAKSGALKAAARNPEPTGELIVNGYIVKSDMYKTRMDVTIESPTKKLFFDGIISSNEELQSEQTSPPETVPEEAEITKIEGKEPSPPEAHEEWDGRWRGTAKTEHVIDSNPKVEMSGEYEFQIVREGSKILLTEGGKTTTLNINEKNPNAARSREEKKESAPVGEGWTKTIDRRFIFLNSGRLYTARKIEVTSHIKLPGLPFGDSHATNFTHGMLDRVK
ncbi:MAG: hypothetical protein V2A66_04995 [Pseudomonadota bacterium]